MYYIIHKFNLSMLHKTTNAKQNVTKTTNAMQSVGCIAIIVWRLLKFDSFHYQQKTASLKRSPTCAKRWRINCGKWGSIPSYDFNFISVLYCIRALLIAKSHLKRSPRQQTQHSQSCTIDIILTYTRRLNRKYAMSLGHLIENTN